MEKKLNISLLVVAVFLVTNFDPCSDNYVYAYLNRADVQEALHAN
ncbi:Peptidase S10, serine carboxypeptidase, partial [Corchorus capsularis]